MDPGRLSNYRSSYLLRFHPYPRVRPSARERVMVALGAVDKDTVSSHDWISIPSFRSADADSDLAGAITQSLNSVIHSIQSLDAPRPQRRLSLSSLVVDLALLARKVSSGI
ncbi:hypothetical protein J3A83DRAFT_4374317 [Scleroderma citrinum]